MYCKNCGKKNPEGSSFCKECGEKIESTPINKEVNAGLGGWLAIVGLSLIISLLYRSYYLSGYFPLFNRTYDIPGYLPLLQFEFVALLALLIVNFYLVYLYFKKNVKFPKYYIVFLITSSIFVIIDYILYGFLTAPTPEEQKVITNTLSTASNNIWQTIIFATIWSLYLKRSKRVKATFINENSRTGAPKVRNWRSLIGKAAAFCIIFLILLYAFSSNFRNSFSSGLNSSQNENSSITQSVINIECDNNEAGSGTIITKSGMALTNNHVISGATSCLITLPDPTTGEPKAIYQGQPITIPNLSEQYDLAFLRITSAYTDKYGKTWGAYPIDFPAYVSSSRCDNYIPKLGDSVRIYGYPITSGGYNLTITDGIVSSFANNSDILTSAKVDSGNSGGLAVNQDGCFLGVPAAVVGGNYQTLGDIIPSNVISEFANKTESSYQTSSTWSSANHVFDFSCLSLKNGQMYGNSYYNKNPTYVASLYNGCSQAVKNVVIRANFYVSGANSNTTPSDTEYVNLDINYLGSGDAHAINGTIVTPFDTSGDFSWDVHVYSADTY